MIEPEGGEERLKENRANRNETQNSYYDFSPILLSFRINFLRISCSFLPGFCDTVTVYCF